MTAHTKCEKNKPQRQDIAQTHLLRFCYLKKTGEFVGH